MTPDSVRRFAQKYLQPDARVVVHGVPGKQELGPEVPKPAAQQRLPPGSALKRSTPTSLARDGAKPGRSALRAADAAVVSAGQRPDGSSRADGNAGRVGEPRRAQRRRRESRRQARPRELHRRDARSGHGDPQRDADRRRSRADRRIADDGLDEGLVDDRDVELARNFPAALNLLADVALRPSFPPEEVEPIARQARQSSCSSKQSESTVNNVAAAALYGLEHPYGFVELGTDVDQEGDARRPPGFLAAAVRAGQCGADRLGRDDVAELAAGESAFGAGRGKAAASEPGLGPRRSRASCSWTRGFAADTGESRDHRPPRSSPD